MHSSSRAEQRATACCMQGSCAVVPVPILGRPCPRITSANLRLRSCPQQAQQAPPEQQQQQAEQAGPTAAAAAAAEAQAGSGRLDPFALVRDEIETVSERLRRDVCTNIPQLEQAAEYFFRAGGCDATMLQNTKRNTWVVGSAHQHPTATAGSRVLFPRQVGATYPWFK